MVRGTGELMMIAMIPSGIDRFISNIFLVVGIGSCFVGKGAFAGEEEWICTGDQCHGRVIGQRGRGEQRG